MTMVYYIFVSPLCAFSLSLFCNYLYYIYWGSLKIEPMG